MMKTKIAVLTVLCSATLWACAQTQASGGSTASPGNAAGSPPVGAAGNPPVGAPGNPPIGVPGNAPNNGNFNNAPASPPNNGNNVPGTPPNNGNNPGTIPPGNGDNGGINNNNPGKDTWNGPGNLTNNGAWQGPGDFNTNSNTGPGFKDGGIGNH